MKRGPYKKHKDAVKPNCVPSFTDPETFIDAKIEMIQGEFKIKLTYDDKLYLRQYKTENEINAAVRGLINKYWK